MRRTESGEKIFRYRNRKNGITDHIAVGITSDETLCGRIGLRTTSNGELHMKDVAPFRGLSGRDTWCSHCLRKFEGSKSKTTAKGDN